MRRRLPINSTIAKTHFFRRATDGEAIVQCIGILEEAEFFNLPGLIQLCKERIAQREYGKLMKASLIVTFGRLRLPNYVLLLLE